MIGSARDSAAASMKKAVITSQWLNLGKLILYTNNFLELAKLQFWLSSMNTDKKSNGFS